MGKNGKVNKNGKKNEKSFLFAQKYEKSLEKVLSVCPSAAAVAAAAPPILVREDAYTFYWG